MQVTVAYARANISELLDAVANGENVTITRRNKPVADLVPARKGKKRNRKYGMFKGENSLIHPHAFDPMTDEQAERFILTGEL